MTSPSLSIQRSIRAALIADAAVSALVPAAQIYDRHQRPEVFPCIVLGEDQEIYEDMTLERDTLRVVSTIHIWSREPSLTGVKTIADALRRALIGNPTVTANLIHFHFENVRFMRDPDGVTAHGVITFEALVGGLEL